MLKTVAMSSSSKTKGCAVTYRAAGASKFGTCPAACPFNPSGNGTSTVDEHYLEAVLNAVPRAGFSMTYTHFPPEQWHSKTGPGKTTINYSAPDMQAAVAAQFAGIDSVAVVGPDFWAENGKNAQGDHGVPIVRCPAEYNKDINCGNCGSRDGPLCARRDRGYVIGFTAHGTRKKLAMETKQGGCYAELGPAGLHWEKTRNETMESTDVDKLLAFARALPPRTVLRHHIAGDLG